MPVSELAALFVVLLAAGAVAGVEALLVFDWLLEKIAGKRRGGRARRLRLPWTIVFLVGCGCLFYAHYIEPFRFEVTHHTVKAARLPQGFRLRVLHLTDLHLEEEGKATRWVAQVVREEKPDVIVLTGDYINNRVAGREAFKELLGQLAAGHVFAVTGNYSPIDPHTLNADVVTLHGSARIVKFDGQDICFAGTGGATAEEFVEQMSRRLAASYTVVLYHSPEMIDLAAQHGADLYLCGHTHGGQVRLPFYGAVLTFSRLGKKYEAGRYQVANTTAYVCRGVGNEGGRIPRLRFLCRPEIAVFDIVGSKEP